MLHTHYSLPLVVSLKNRCALQTMTYFEIWTINVQVVPHDTLNNYTLGFLVIEKIKIDSNV